MKCGRVLLALAVMASGSCRAQGDQWQFSPEIGAAMTRMCLGEYTEHTGRGLTGEADRAYIWSRWDVSWILFATGEEGSFGEPGPDFRPFLGCVVATRPRLQVQKLYEMLTTIIDMELKTFEHFDHPDDEFVVSVFMRHGDGFFHFETRPYSLEEALAKRRRMHQSPDVPDVLEIQ